MVSSPCAESDSERQPGGAGDPLDCRMRSPHPGRTLGAALPHLNINLVALFSEREWSGYKCRPLVVTYLSDLDRIKRDRSEWPCACGLRVCTPRFSPLPERVAGS
jgi:hypothetical protein